MLRVFLVLEDGLELAALRSFRERMRLVLADVLLLLELGVLRCDLRLYQVLQVRGRCVHLLGDQTGIVLLDRKLPSLLVHLGQLALPLHSVVHVLGPTGRGHGPMLLQLPQPVVMLLFWQGARRPGDRPPHCILYCASDFGSHRYIE